MPSHRVLCYASTNGQENANPLSLLYLFNTTPMIPALFVAIFTAVCYARLSHSPVSYPHGFHGACITAMMSSTTAISSTIYGDGTIGSQSSLERRRAGGGDVDQMTH